MNILVRIESGKLYEIRRITGKGIERASECPLVGTVEKKSGTYRVKDSDGDVIARARTLKDVEGVLLNSQLLK